MSRLDPSARALVGSLLLAVLLVPRVAAEFVPLDPARGPAVDWITENRDGILIGSDSRVYGAEFAEQLTLRERFALDADVDSVVAVGRRLLLVRQGVRLALLEPNAIESRELVLGSPVRGRLSPLVLGDLLLLAEDGVGLRFMRILSGHHDGQFELTPIGRLVLAERFTAVAASGRTAYVATAAGRLYEIDGAAPGGPRLVRQSALREPVHALAADQDRLLALGAGGLTVYELFGDRYVATAALPEMRGTALQLHGRLVYVAGPDGLQSWRDRTAGAQTHLVTVGNDFFSPADLSIDVHDSVQWSMAALGAFHNVESCVPATSGCFGQSADLSFTSGPVAGAPWIYSFQFTREGSNPYVCLSHLPFMTGRVQAGGAPGHGPRVPLDDIGHPSTLGLQ